MPERPLVCDECNAAEGVEEGWWVFPSSRGGEWEGTRPASTHVAPAPGWEGIDAPPRPKLASILGYSNPVGECKARGEPPESSSPEGTNGWGRGEVVRVPNYLRRGKGKDTARVYPRGPSARLEGNRRSTSVSVTVSIARRQVSTGGQSSGSKV